MDIVNQIKLFCVFFLLIYTYTHMFEKWHSDHYKRSKKFKIMPPPSREYPSINCLPIESFTQTFYINVPILN